MNKNIRKNLISLLKKRPYLVDDYNALVSYYWSIFDGVKSIGDIIFATPSESITRNLRHLISKGLVPTPRRQMKSHKNRTFINELATLI